MTCDRCPARATVATRSAETWPCGHPRTAENTQKVGRAGVRCRACRRIIQARATAKLKAARAQPVEAPRPCLETMPFVGHRTVAAWSPQKVVKLDLRNAPSGMEALAASWREKAKAA